MGVKISDLPQATTSQNDDIFPMVQEGVTKQVSKELLLEEVNNKCIISPTEPEVDYGVWFAKGKNLFDKNNVYVLNAYITTENGVITSDSTSKTVYIKIKPSTTYTVSKMASERFKIATYSSFPVIGSTSNNVVSDNSATSLTITSGANDNYLAVWLYYSTRDTATFQQIINTVQIEEGSTATTYEPYITPSINVDGDEIYNQNVGIVESGSNANGSYVKFGDGTMIQHIEKKYDSFAVTSNFDGHYFGSTGNITFPIPFIDSPTVQATVLGNGVMLWISLFNVTTELCGAYIQKWTTGTVSNIKVYITAIGRWK